MWCCLTGSQAGALAARERGIINPLVTANLLLICRWTLREQGSAQAWQTSQTGLKRECVICTVICLRRAASHTSAGRQDSWKTCLAECLCTSSFAMADSRQSAIANCTNKLLATFAWLCGPLLVPRYRSLHFQHPRMADRFPSWHEPLHGTTAAKSIRRSSCWQFCQAAQDLDLFLFRKTIIAAWRSALAPLWVVFCFRQRSLHVRHVFSPFQSQIAL